MQKYHRHFNTTATPQHEPMPGAKTKQVKMRSGGYGWKVGDWDRLERFLILGTEGGTYYVREHKLTIDAANAVTRCIDKDGPRVVQIIVDVSQGGRAPKNDPALFALAMCAKMGDERTKAAAYQALPKVARIGTHLFHFMEYAKAFGGKGGNGFKRALARWYTDKPSEKLSYQVVKYQQRDGWSHRDILRLAHPSTESPIHQDIFRWVVKGELPEWRAATEPGDMGTILGFEAAKTAENVKEVVGLIEQYDLPREAIPTQWLNKVEVWKALLPKMPVFAMIRNLGKMTSLGMVTNTSEETRHIVKTITDEARLIKGRVHPLAVLTALKTYRAGKGFRGSLTWSPAARVVDALDDAFYKSFKAVQPTDKRLCLALDVSGSMSSAMPGVPFVSCYEGAAAMAMVTARVESTYEIMGFTAGGPGFISMGSDRRTMFGTWGRSGNGLVPLSISPRQRLDDIVQYMRGLPMGGTDASLPIRWARDNKIAFDAFVTYTDNESWAGPEHVAQAMKSYRDTMGIDAKLIAVAFSADKYSVCDPDDALMMDVVGFDTATPNVISDFIAH